MSKLPLLSDRRIAFANSLRGIAAFSVVLTHYFGLYWDSRPVIANFTAMDPLSSSIETPALVVAFNNAIHPAYLGPFGVALFFLISGFVIPFSFEKMSRLQFLIGRAFRIWPTYFIGFIISITLVLIAVWIDGQARPLSFRTILEHSIVGGREIFSIGSMDGVIWTLEVEVRFYLVAALIYPALARGFKLAFVAPVVLLLAAYFEQSQTSYAWMSGSLAQELFVYVPYVIFMFVGVAFNFYYRGYQSALQSAILIALVSASSYLALRLVLPDYTFIARSYFLAILVFSVSMLLGDRIRWNWAPLAFLAEISFSLYVVHALTGYVVLNFLLVRLSVNSYVALLTAFIVALTFATILNRAVERPSQRLGKKIADRAAGGPCTRPVRLTPV
jgi:peptidoglycan/LPS O-acetylase OafA/YrhL